MAREALPSRARRGRPRRCRCERRRPRFGGSGGAATAATTDAAPATAEVMRRNLVLVDDVDGTLGYADARTLAASAPGTVTRLPAEGLGRHPGPVAVRRERGGVRLLYGSMPLWRRLGPGVSDGADVEQLERNLVELGHDPGGMTVDEEFDADTASAVESWQDAIGVPETGAVEPGDAVFLPGPRRVGQLAVSVGVAAAAGNGGADDHRDGAGRPARPRRTPAGAGHGRWEGEGRAAVGTRRRRDDRLRGEGRRVVDRRSGRARAGDGRAS